MARIEIRFLIDWPRGRLGYLPRSRREAASIDKPHRRGARKQVARIDLGRTWLDAQREARRHKKGAFHTFLDELADDIAHEYAHAFEPKFTRERCGEEEAQLFAMYGRRTRL